MKMVDTIRKDIIMHPRFKGALHKIERIQERSKEHCRAEGLLITGPSGAGKTTLIEYVKSKHPSYEAKDRYIIPVLVIDTPPVPSVKGVVGEIQLKLSGTIVGGTTEFQTKRVCTLIKEMGVELIVIDEFQHFVDRRLMNEFGKAADWLKSLINAVNVPVVIFGLPQCVEVLEINEQLRRRFSARYDIKPFGFDTKDQRSEFKGVLKGIQASLPVSCREDLYANNLVRRFHFASNGIFDYLVKIIDRSLEIADEQEMTVLEWSMFAQAFEEEVWNEVPEQLNPFKEKFIFRRLTHSGEPFAPVQLAISKIKGDRKVRSKN